MFLKYAETLDINVQHMLCLTFSSLLLLALVDVQVPWALGAKRQQDGL